MTENEAIKELEKFQLQVEHSIAEEERCEYDNLEKALQEDKEFLEAFDMAITALKEIQKYREIGTVEEIKDLLVTISEASEDVDESGISAGLIKDLIRLGKYREIGTVEDCREAREKQIPKKPHKNYEKFSGLWCKCGWYLGKKTCLDIKYCPNCGQAIDENLEV